MFMVRSESHYIVTETSEGHHQYQVPNDYAYVCFKLSFISVINYWFTGILFDVTSHRVVPDQP